MFNPRNPNDPEGFFKYGWKYRYCPSAHEIADYVSKYRCGTAIWRNFERLKKNFMFADWIPIDVDDGMSLDYAMNHIKDYIHVVGTTKSHQIPKKNSKDPKGPMITCDRFRIFLKFQNRVHDIDDYEYTTKKWARIFKADMSVAGAQAMVRPCKPVSIKYYGKLITPVDGKMEKEKSIKKFEQKIDGYKGEKIVPSWIKQMLNHGVNGGRNNMVLKFASTLKKCGFSEEETVDMIMNSPNFISGPHSFSKSECERTVRNGFK
jgi:hypothetical protein